MRRSLIRSSRNCRIRATRAPASLRFGEFLLQQHGRSMTKNVAEIDARVDDIGKVAAEDTAGLFGLEADQHDPERAAGPKRNGPGLHAVGGKLVAGPMGRRHRRAVMDNEHRRCRGQNFDVEGPRRGRIVKVDIPDRLDDRAEGPAGGEELGSEHRYPSRYGAHPARPSAWTSLWSELRPVRLHDRGKIIPLTELKTLFRAAAPHQFRASASSTNRAAASAFASSP